MGSNSCNLCRLKLGCIVAGPVSEPAQRAPTMRSNYAGISPQLASSPTASFINQLLQALPFSAEGVSNAGGSAEHHPVASPFAMPKSTTPPQAGQFSRLL